MPINAATDFVRFMRLVQIGTEKHDCWRWLGSKDRVGYGHFVLNKKGLKAHRWIYQLIYGQIEDGLIVRHKCDVPSCVNPIHLELGTQKDNCMDCVKRGRHPKARIGEDHPICKLSNDEVLEIRRLYAIGHSCAQIGRDKGMTRTHIHKIATRQIWSHI